MTNMPYIQLSAALPNALRKVLSAIPTPAPVLPDFGVPLQLVDADDVASALCAGTLGRGEPGVYNLAAPGLVRMSDVARALGWRSVRIPKAALDATAEVLSRFPLATARAEWLHTLRTPVIMDTRDGQPRARVGSGLRRARDVAPDGARRPQPGADGPLKARARLPAKPWSDRPPKP